MFGLKKWANAFLVTWIMIAQSDGGFSVFPMPTLEECEKKVIWAVEQGAKGGTCFDGEDPIYTTDPSLATNQNGGRSAREKRRERRGR